MHTQRVNVYRTVGEDGKPVFTIDEYSPEINQWVQVGLRYSNVDKAVELVTQFNALQLAKKMKEWGL